MKNCSCHSSECSKFNQLGSNKLVHTLVDGDKVDEYTKLGRGKGKGNAPTCGGKVPFSVGEDETSK
eukprot:7720522-Karenia_brevis.AAC.1